MRVLQLAKFYPPERGGIESVVHELAEGLNAIGKPTDVLCAHRHWKDAVETMPGGFKVVRAGSLGMLQSTSIAPSLIGWCAKLASDYDVVHVHMPNPLAALAIWRARPRARLVVHWHSDVISQRMALKLYEPLQRWLLRRADAVIVTSQAYAQASAALQLCRGKLVVLPLGIGDNSCLPDPGRVAELRSRWPDKTIVFALGRMTPYKGFDVLVEAATQLPDDVIVAIGGSGPALERLKRRASELKLDGKVNFLGSIPEEDLPAHYLATDMFCLPSISRAEAFGVAQLEAMRAGKPVVCSALEGSGVAWVTQDGETGLAVEPGSPGALAQAIGRLAADDALRSRLGEAGRARFLAHFTARTMIEKTAALYERLASR